MYALLPSFPPVSSPPPQPSSSLLPFPLPLPLPITQNLIRFFILKEKFPKNKMKTTNSHYLSSPSSPSPQAAQSNYVYVTSSHPCLAAFPTPIPPPSSPPGFPSHPPNLSPPSPQAAQSAAVYLSAAATDVPPNPLHPKLGCSWEAVPLSYPRCLAPAAAGAAAAIPQLLLLRLLCCFMD